MQGDRYSQVVGWLKILLPLLALGLLATMFLFARAPAPSGGVPFSEIEAIARDPRIGAPRFSGVTPSGVAVSLGARAVRAVAGQGAVFAIDDLHIEIVAPTGESVKLTTATGIFESDSRRAMLDGLARIESSSGYLIEAAGIEVDLAEGTLQTRNALAARAPFGEFEAGGLDVTDGGAHIVFNNGVRLLYLPPVEGARP